MTLDRAAAPVSAPDVVDPVLDDPDPDVLGRVLAGLRGLPTAPASSASSASASASRDGDEVGAGEVPLPRRRR